MNKKLIQSGLFASRLVPIEGQLLVDRYNRCLVQLGSTPTKLTSFRIDCYGWSPEIAQEKGNKAYLSYGDSSPFAIIISPKQYGLPAFYPFHNFDRKIMQFIFEDYKDQIEEITKTTAIIVDVDRYVSFLESPLSFIGYDRITVKPTILGNLQDGKIEQDHLIEEFMDGEKFLTLRAQQKLLANVKEFGDLRGKKILMEPNTYPANSFYTRMFGGVFIFRDKQPSNLKPLLVVLDKTWMEKLEQPSDCTLAHISDPKIMNILQKKGFLQELSDQKLLSRMKTWAFVHAIADKPREHRMSEIMANAGLMKQYLQRYRDELSLYTAIENGTIDSDPVAGWEPNRNLKQTQYRLVWKLLTNVHYYDIFLLYKWNKEKFYLEFETYPDDVQDWIVDFVVRENNLYNSDPRNK